MPKIVSLNTIIILKNAFAFAFCWYYRTKHIRCQKKVCLNCKAFKYWIDNIFFFNFSPKIVLKKCVECFFQIKIEHIGFQENVMRYQRELMFLIFFQFWSACLPWTETIFPITNPKSNFWYRHVEKKGWWGWDWLGL